MLAVGVVAVALACGDGAPADATAHATHASGVATRASRADDAPDPPADGATLVAELGCAACHAGVGSVNDARASAPDLTGVGARRSPGELFALLTDTTAARRTAGRARMPDFHLDDGERLALTLYLGTLRGDGGGSPASARSATAHDDTKRLDAAVARARAAHPGITAVTGKRIFVALDCAGCHAAPGASPWLNGPDLSAEGSRVNPEWLRAYLARPHAVRPFGTYPGTGSRMPDFHLTPGEVDSLATYLDAKRIALPPFEPRPLSVFVRHEAESLLRDKLPCLGCHQLGGEGGRLGPDLSRVHERLQPAYLHAMITDPRHTAPWTIMPKVPMPARTLELIADYLADRAPAPAPPPPYLSLVDHVALDSLTLLSARSGARTGPALYHRICANCHGSTGGGDGWNARYLPVQPTRHAAARYMSTRPDGTLYDGIAAGGAILDRSNRMPPFGETLSRAEIWSLVAYIRTLCHCQGPAWSRDGVSP